MKKNLFPLVIVLFVALSFINVLGQEKTPERTYKIYTHTIVGSNDSGNKDKLSNNLAKAFENVRDNFSYSNYKLLSTQFQLIKHKGSIEYKSVLKDFETSNNSAPPIFAEWNYRNFEENTIDGKNKGSFSLFQFIFRFPVKYADIKKDGETTTNVVNERLGLTARNVEFMVGQPTVFASFPIEYNDKTLFFVVHIEEVN